MNVRMLLAVVILGILGSSAISLFKPSGAKGEMSTGSGGALHRLIQLIPLSSGDVIAGPGVIDGCNPDLSGFLLRHGLTNEQNLRAWITIENTGEITVRIKRNSGSQEILLVKPGESMTTDFLLGGSSQFRDAIMYEFLSEGGRRRFRYVIRHKL